MVLVAAKIVDFSEKFATNRKVWFEFDASIALASNLIQFDWIQLWRICVLSPFFIRFILLRVFFFCLKLFSIFDPFVRSKNKSSRLFLREIIFVNRVWSTFAYLNCLLYASAEYTISLNNIAFSAYYNRFSFISYGCDVLGLYCNNSYRNKRNKTKQSERWKAVIHTFYHFNDTYLMKYALFNANICCIYLLFFVLMHKNKYVCACFSIFGFWKFHLLQTLPAN